MPAGSEVFHFDTSRSGPIDRLFTDREAKFDAAENLLLEKYARYMEKPSPRKMRQIDQASESTFEAFGDVVEGVMSGQTGVINARFLPRILATLVSDVSREHMRLFAQYSDFVEIPSDEAQEADITSLAGIFEEFDEEALLEGVIDYFCEIRDGDMEAIQQVMINRIDSPIEQIKMRALHGSIEVAKIGAGVLAGLVVYDTFFRSK